MIKFLLSKLKRSSRIALGYLLTWILCTEMVGCSRYSVTVNDNLVYQPPGLFRDYIVKDPALAACVSATITENNLTGAEQLLKLVCPPGSILDLDGIASFPAIEYLGLANNKVTDLQPVSMLTQIKQLNVKNNDIRSFTPVISLKQLNFLDAQGNIHANCDSLKDNQETLKIKLPSHCGKG